MKVLVIGSGGREHTIAWRLAQSNRVSEVICVPGNGGTAHEAKCKNIDPKENPALQNLSLNEVAVNVALSQKVDFAVIGPEDPLAEAHPHPGFLCPLLFFVILLSFLLRAVSAGVYILE